MKIRENVSLERLTSFKIGGKASFFCQVKSLKDLNQALSFAKKRKLPYLILGGGTNVLISDKGYKGLVIKIGIKGISRQKKGQSLIYKIGAGENWDKFVEKTVNDKAYGLENLSGIPGSVGGAPVQNIGAYAQEVKDTITKVQVFDIKTSRLKNFQNKNCQFAYRQSIFKKEAGRYIILHVFFKLKQNSGPNLKYKDLLIYFADKKRPNLREIRNAILNIRALKFPDPKKIGTAGSFFKNPIVTKRQLLKLKRKYEHLVYFSEGNNEYKLSLAWIIDKICHLKNLRIGDALINDKQPLVLVNRGKATAKEIKKLSEMVEKKVFDKTGIKIEKEVVYI